MRIASLLPSATEIVCALGREAALVGISHECDFPTSVRDRPRLTRSAIPAGLSAAQIDRTVAERAHRGEALYEVDAEALGAARPDVVLTQAVCDVCAVSEEDVRRIAATLPGSPAVVSLDATSLDGVLADVSRVAEAIGAIDAGRSLCASLGVRLEAVASRVAGRRRPRVVALEWIEPPFAAGHWVPEMVARAGAFEALGKPGEKSFRTTWDAVAAAEPEVLIVVPCGYDRAAAEDALASVRRRTELARVQRLHALDASAFFSRPGPRLIDGVEALATLLHG